MKTTFKTKGNADRGFLHTLKKDKCKVLYNHQYDLPNLSCIYTVYYFKGELTL